MPNPDGVLKPGQFVRVRLLGATRPDAIAGAQRAVLEGPQGKFVYVAARATSGKAPCRPAGAGGRPDRTDRWLGLSEGLKPGDQVIVDGVMRICPGAPVQIGRSAARRRRRRRPPQPASK